MDRIRTDTNSDISNIFEYPFYCFFTVSIAVPGAWLRAAPVKASRTEPKPHVCACAAHARLLFSSGRACTHATPTAHSSPHSCRYTAPSSLPSEALTVLVPYPRHTLWYGGQSKSKRSLVRAPAEYILSSLYYSSEIITRISFHIYSTNLYLVHI